jgi:type VI protein secretion system component Hcp
MAAPVEQQQRETIMSKHENKLIQKSRTKTEISGAIDDNDLDKVTGGGKASPKETSPTEAVSLHYGSIAWTYTQ